ncbi:MAG: hypothetical protein WCS52_02300 [bacterium]
MKSLKFIVSLVLLVIVMSAAAYAASVYDRSVQSLGTTTGSAVWTNTWKYSAVELKRIWVVNPLVASNNVAISRISADNVYTQTVGTVAVLSSAGNTASFTAGFLKYGDKLLFSSDISTGSTVMVEYEVQQ